MNDEKHPVDASPEQRQEYRLTTVFTIFIELPSAEADGEAPMIISRSLDVSANGMRVIADRELPVGSILRTCVQENLQHADSHHFILISETKWARPYGEQGEFLMGLSLFESEDSDIVRWKEFVAQCCATET